MTSYSFVGYQRRLTNKHFHTFSNKNIINKTIEKISAKEFKNIYNNKNKNKHYK